MKPAPPTAQIPLLAALLLVVLALPALGQGKAMESVDWWIRQYGEIEENELVAAARAREVFERVRAAAGLPGQWQPRLYLIEGSKPFARALPEDAILVSRGAVELCYAGWRPGQKKAGERGDASMAFVLGHELAHGVRKDFAAFDAGRPEAQQVYELSADLEGLLYLWWAGYDPDVLLERKAEFFARWYTAGAPHPALDGATHPSPETRAETLTERAEAIVESVPYFHFGVRLLQLGRHRDALRLLEEFKLPFASREVLSNLGLAHLELAAEALAGCDGRLVTRFKLPSVIDPETLAGRSRRRGGATRSPCFDNRRYRERMEQAVGYLERAAEMDPGYLPARLNLFAARALAAEGSRALTVAGQILELAPEDPRAANADALALYQMGEEAGLDTADKALGKLEAALRRHPRASYLLYNLAALNVERKRMGAARELWQAFLEVEPTGPHAEWVRERLGVEAPAPPPEPPAPPEPPVPLGAVDRRRLERSGLERHRLTAGDLNGSIWSGGRVQALQIGAAIEVVEERFEVEPPEGSPPTVEEYLLRHGPPLATLELARGARFLRWRDFALETGADGRVRAMVHFVAAE